MLYIWDNLQTFMVIFSEAILPVKERKILFSIWIMQKDFSLDCIDHYSSKHPYTAHMLSPVISRKSLDLDPEKSPPLIFCKHEDHMQINQSLIGFFPGRLAGAQSCQCHVSMFCYLFVVVCLSCSMLSSQFKDQKLCQQIIYFFKKS